MLKKRLFLLMAVLLCIGLLACAGDKKDPTPTEPSCEHSYSGATCTDAAVCEICGETKSNSWGHIYFGGSCTKAAKCILCGGESATLKDHKYTEATCTAPAKCTVCGETKGIATGHNVGGASKRCTKCGELVVTSVTSAYRGKTLEIWGMGTDESYTYYDNFGKGNYIWMMRAAIDEWAAMNGVTIRWCGSYNQNALLAAMNAGENPDIVFHTNQYPAIANNGVISALTDAEYAKLAQITGNSWLDMLTYGSQKMGVVLPWVGTTMCYYNKTMFENYGVKTPMEYFNEGNWTWETFMKCMEEMTKDVDSDGTFDTYGLPADSFGYLVNPWAQNEKGELVSTIDEPWMQDFFQLKYDAYTVKKVVLVPGKNQIQKNVTYPMTAMQLSECEPYNFEHMFQTIANGDELEVVPVPRWVGQNGQTLSNTRVTMSCVSLTVACDERDASVDLLCYLMQCGLKYISDYSLGTVKCDYVGIQGTSPLSKQWKEAFAKVCADRAADYKELINAKRYASAHIAKVNAYLNSADKSIIGTYSRVTQLTSFAEITQMPPDSSIPAIKQKYQNMLDVYNSTYINN